MNYRHIIFITIALTVWCWFALTFLDARYNRSKQPQNKEKPCPDTTPGTIPTPSRHGSRPAVLASQQRTLITPIAGRGSVTS